MTRAVLVLAGLVATSACSSREESSTPMANAPLVTLTDDAIALMRELAGDRKLEDLYIHVAINFDEDDPYRVGNYFRYFLDVGDAPLDGPQYTWRGLHFSIARESAPFLAGAVISSDTTDDGTRGFRFSSPLLPSSDS